GRPAAAGTGRRHPPGEDVRQRRGRSGPDYHGRINNPRRRHQCGDPGDSARLDQTRQNQEGRKLMSKAENEGRIEIRDLVLQYRNTPTPAVDSIDLTIEPGEFMTLLGPSGSGKTTTLNLLAGFLQPTSGSIQLNSRDLVSVPPNKRSFGMVFQDYALFPHMTVFENVAFPLRQRRKSRGEIQALVNDVLGRFGLAGFEGRKPSELSGGQRQ